MKAFHGKGSVKKKYLARVIAHQKADELVKGETGEEGKGCAAWCTLDAYDHSRYPIELGIPEWLARVEDTLFEGMSLKKSKTWPEKFLKAIKPGSDLEKIKSEFLITVLKQNFISLDKTEFDETKFPEVRSAINQTKEAVKLTIKAERLKTEKARSAAYSAYSAYSAADSARSTYSAIYDSFADKLIKLLKKCK